MYPLYLFSNWLEQWLSACRHQATAWTYICCLTSNGVLWHSHGNNFNGSASEINSWKKFEIYKQNFNYNPSPMSKLINYSTDTLNLEKMLSSERWSDSGAILVHYGGNGVFLRKGLVEDNPSNGDQDCAAWLRTWCVGNCLSSGDAGSSLVQVMPRRLFGAEPLPEPNLTFCHFDPWWYLGQKTEVFFRESMFANIPSKNSRWPISGYQC